MHQYSDGHGTLWEQEGRPLQGKSPQCLVSVACSGSLSSCSIPGQDSLGGLELWVLLLNARLVNNKAPVIQDLTEEEHADLAYIIKTWLSLDGDSPFRDVSSQV